MKKTVLLLLFTLLLATSIFAQKRTTSVKGYYRKDGTYVRPHTRSYTPSSSTSSTYNYSSTSSSSDVENIQSTSLKFSTGTKTDENSYNLENVNYKGQKIRLTTLKFIADSTLNEKTKENKAEGAIVFYVSVLRYKGKTLDVCPVPRGYSSWSFDKVDHKFDKKLISTEDALDLISNYGWRIYENLIMKDFSYSYGDKSLPSYLTKTIEAIVVE